MEPVVQRARTFTPIRHQGRNYSPGTFFELRLIRVFATFDRFGERDPVTLVAAWLHDVSNPGRLDPARSRRGIRRKRQAKAHVKIRANSKAAPSELADQIANVESNLRLNTPLVNRMYPFANRYTKSASTKTGGMI